MNNLEVGLMGKRCMSYLASYYDWNFNQIVKSKIFINIFYSDTNKLCLILLEKWS
jgi:hypothetical protein